MSETYLKYLKMADDDALTQRIVEWNRVRNGLEFNPALEVKL